jgi:hypothetical protein
MTMNTKRYALKFTKREAVKHFRLWFADLKAENGGKADRWISWGLFLRVNVEEGNLPEKALDWVCP